MPQYRLSELVVLRRETFGGIAFHTRRGITLELDTEGFDLLSSFTQAQPLPDPCSDAYALAFELRRSGFIHRIGTHTGATALLPGKQSQPAASQNLAAPEIVHLALTAVCDLSCPGCYALGGKEALSWSALQDLIDQLADMRVFQLALGGGEPTLHPHLIDVVIHARQRNIVPNLTTHGGHLTPTLITALRDAGIGQVNVSLNANEPEHNSGRGSRPWQAAIYGLEQLHDSRIAVGVNCLVTADNLHHLPDTLAYLAGFNVRHVTILGPKPANDPSWLAVHQLADDDYARLTDILTQWQDRLNITIDCALVSRLMNHIPADTLRAHAIYGCAAANRMCVIDAKGDVWPCAFQQSPQFFAENILSTRFRELWLHSVGFQRFRSLGCGGMTPCCQCGDNQQSDETEKV